MPTPSPFGSKRPAVNRDDDDSRVVSLESHRRRRLAEARQKQAKPRMQHERAINWRRAPFFLAALAVFMLFSWLVRHAGAYMHLN